VQLKKCSSDENESSRIPAVNPIPAQWFSSPQSNGPPDIYEIAEIFAGWPYSTIQKKFLPMNPSEGRDLFIQATWPFPAAIKCP
jgi:hypothetical protein